MLTTLPRLGRTCPHVRGAADVLCASSLSEAPGACTGVSGRPAPSGAGRAPAPVAFWPGYHGATSAFTSGVANATSVALTAVPATTASSWPGGKQWTFGFSGKAAAGLRQSQPARWSWAGPRPPPDAVAVRARVAAPTTAHEFLLSRLDVLEGTSARLPRASGATAQIAEGTTHLVRQAREGPQPACARTVQADR
jgi:hypothetical protein